MPAYRLYHLDPFSGHITGVEELHAGSDIELVHALENRPRTGPMELWQAHRKVRRFDAVPDVGAPTPGYTVETI